jgi:hypothetical protein
MRISLGSRVARACAAALVISLSAAPSFARTGGVGGASFGRPGLGPGHAHGFAPRGLKPGFGPNRFGFNRFGSKPVDRFGFNRFGRFGFNRFGNQLLIGGWGSYGWGGVPVSTGVSEPIILGGGAPVIINVGAEPAPSGAGYEGGCVIHKLIYDSAGKYVGERQSPQC